MKKSQTPSEKHRQQGNEFFAKLKGEPQAAPVLRRGRFNDALKCYNQAFSTSVNDDERASACKNLGTLFAYQTGTMNIESVSKKDFSYNVKECILSYGRAHEYGEKTKSNDWSIALRHQINDFVYDRCATFLMLPGEEQMELLIFVANCFGRTALEKLDSVATVYYSLGKLTFKKAVSCFKETPELVYDCQPHLDRALYWACEPNKFRPDDIEELRRSIWLHQCMHESANARRTGVRMLESHMDNDEEINMDLIWEIIDKFRQAILLAKEVDIEGKARACHHTAIVYQKVLRMTELAYTYHLRCVTLALTLVPRNLTSLEWYSISSSFVQQYRAKKAREEEALNEEQIKKYRLELALDLEQLEKTAEKAVYLFLIWIYTKHPPRKENAKMGSLEPKELVKTVRNAILHYHPDGQSSFNDPKWSFLCSEITKLLNKIYEKFKNV